MSYLRVLTTLFFAVLLGVGVQPVRAENNIKLIIDVSGSMKKNDPENLRRPAVNLLMNLLPEDSYAGVWLFGDQVEVLVPFGVATQDFKRQAVAQSGKIHSKGLLTDVGAVLEQAMLTPPMGGKAILLSDGMVDIGKDVSANQAETARIKHKLIPNLRAGGSEIHTVALSPQADREVLSEIATGTGGLFETASSPEDLTRIFLRLFDDAVIQDRLPLENGVFLVDSSVEEFTLLAFHAEESTPIQLRSPNNEYYLATDHPSYVRWYQDAGYDLVTISRPIEGEWKLFADEDPQNRITALSDLKLKVTNLANMVHEESIPYLEVQFYQANGLVTEQSFLDLMDVQLIVLTPSGKRIAKPLEEYQAGTFSSNLNIFAEPGRYRIAVNVDGRTFKREVVQEVEYGTAAKVVYTPSTETLTVRPVAVGMLDGDMRMIARVIDAEGKKKLLPMKHNGDTWETSLKEMPEGQYQVTVHVKGTASTGQPLDFDLPTTEIELVHIEQIGEVQEDSFWSLDNHYLLAVIGISNLLLLGLIFWFVRRRPVQAEDAEIEKIISAVDIDPDRAPADTATLEAALEEAKAMQSGIPAPSSDNQDEAPETKEASEEAIEAATEEKIEEETQAATPEESQERAEEAVDAPQAEDESATVETKAEAEEAQASVEEEPENEGLTDSEFDETGEGLSDIVDAWNDAPDDEDFEDAAPAAETESAEEPESVTFDPPANEAEAELEAKIEAASDPEEDVDENAKTVQLGEPEIPASDDDDDEELPVDSASSG